MKWAEIKEIRDENALSPGSLPFFKMCLVLSVSWK